MLCRIFCGKLIREHELEINNLKVGNEKIVTDLKKRIQMQGDLITTMKESGDQNAEQWNEELMRLESENELLLKQIENKIPIEIMTLSDSLTKKYPSANILYAGYNIKLKSGNVRPDIAVQDFITPLYSHREWLESRKLTLKQYLVDHPGESFGEVLNKLMFDIFQSWAPTKRYEYDSDLYGVTEQWTPALDSWYVKKMDCENSSLELMALFKAAGIIGPLQAFAWIVCGNCPLGGHATVNAYDFSDGSWRHLESTRTSVPVSSFSKLPKHDDPSDKLNITDVWFSFNSEIARHTFKTDAAKESYEKRERFRNFIIKNDK